jgi:hypothetical protein
LQGANMLVLNSSQQNQVDFFFNSNLQAGGTSN